MYSIPNLKYKTTLCNNWLEGTLCQKGVNCYFAHGQSELRSLQQNQQIIASRNYFVSQYQPMNNFKTVYCKFYMKGQCKLGVSCTFAHQKKQKRKMNRENFIQPPAMFSYMQFSPTYYYQSYQQIGGQLYQDQNMQSFSPIPIIVEKSNQGLESQKKVQIQSKSQQKKRSRIEQSSTTSKQKSEINNEEDVIKEQKKNQCFNFQ